MSLDADLIVDRRRMRRKLTFWRVVAIAGCDLLPRRISRAVEPPRRVLPEPAPASRGSRSAD